MEKPTNKSSLKPKLQKTKAKVASTLRGNPAEKLKIIAVTGDSGKNIVAAFIYKTLIAHKIPTALITSPSSSPLTSFTLQNYLSKSLKSGASHVVIEAPSTVLANYVFHELPLHMSVLTNTDAANLIGSASTDHATASSAIFQNTPDFIVLNRDDPSYDRFATFTARTATTSFGQDKTAAIRINRSKLYKKGTEANLSINGTNLDLATFVVGEAAVAYMAAAAAAAALLDVPNDTIVDGIASYEP